MAAPWALLLIAGATAALNINAQRSGQMMSRNPLALLRRSDSPNWFLFNLIGRWVIVAVLLGLIAAGQMGLLPH